MLRLLRRLGSVVDIAGRSLEDAARDIAAEHPDGILALADSLLEWTAAVAAPLDLPFLSGEAATRLTDKHAQRVACARPASPCQASGRSPIRTTRKGGLRWRAPPDSRRSSSRAAARAAATWSVSIS